MAIWSEGVLKHSIVLLCLVHIAFGSILVLAGFSITRNLKEFDAFIVPEQYFNTPYSSFIIGFCLYLVSAIGICGIAKEKAFVLVLYAGTLGYLLFMGGLVIFSGIHDSTAIKEDLQFSLHFTLQKYYERSHAGAVMQKGWIQLQMHLQCCGVSNYTDWINSQQRLHFQVTPIVPYSCCDIQTAGCSNEYFSYKEQNISNHVFKEGCLTKSIEHISFEKIQRFLIPLECLGIPNVFMPLLLAWKWRTPL